MQVNQDKASGWAVVLGLLLIVITMLHHPTGGGIDHLQKISSIILITHSMALLSMPLLSFGFFGLSRRMGSDPTTAYGGLVCFAFGMVASFVAGIVNGIVLPIFIGRIANSTAESDNFIQLIMKYNFSLNTAFALVSVAGISLAVALWSIGILRTRLMPVWLGVLGLAEVVAVIIALFFGHDFSTLFGFRTFIFGLAAWSLAAGVQLLLSDK